MGEIGFLAIFGVIAIFMYGMTGSFRISKMDISGGAALFPRIIIILFLICVIVRIFQILRMKDKTEFIWKNIFKKGRLEFVIALIVYALILAPLGYIISTSLFLLFSVNLFYYLGYDNFGSAKQIVLRSSTLIIFTVALYFVFSNILMVGLPAGILNF